MSDGLVQLLRELERVAEIHDKHAPFVLAGCRLAIAGDPQAGLVPGADPVSVAARAAYNAGVEIGSRYTPQALFDVLEDLADTITDDASAWVVWGLRDGLDKEGDMSPPDAADAPDAQTYAKRKPAWKAGLALGQKHMGKL